MRVRGRILLTTVTVAFIVVLGAFRPPIPAPQEIPTEEQYAALMREIQATVGDAALHIDASYFGDLGVDTDRLAMLFGQVEAFWTARQVPAAVDFTAKALAAAYALGQASGVESASRANQAISDLRAVCESCHSEFRERIDGGFRIKPGI